MFVLARPSTQLSWPMKGLHAPHAVVPRLGWGAPGRIPHSPPPKESPAAQRVGAALRKGELLTAE